MNAIRLQEILSVRYNTDWAGLRNKLSTIYKPGSICSYCNHLSSRPVGHTMQKTLKAKIQNVLSLSSYNDAECPALFVGGRRRNRRKKKNKNGQAKKKKARKGTVHDKPVVASSPTLDSSFEDELVVYTGRRSPKVSCLDIQEPVFHDIVKPNKLTLVEENDSVYGSSGSLVSCLYEDNQVSVQNNKLQITEIDDESKVILEDKTASLPRTHSEDSGVFDDELVEDAGYEEASEDELDISITDDAFENDISSDESFAEIFKDDEQVIESEQCVPSNAEASLDSVDFDEIDLSEDDECPNDTAHNSVEESIKSELDKAEEIAKSDIIVTESADDEDKASINEVKDISEVVTFVNIENQDGEDDIIFDLSQLELNNTQEEFSKIPNNNEVTMLSEVLFNPTELEETVPLRVPMDLLIDDDDKDEVLFEATKKKDLSITCNPLYEHTLREEEEKLSIKSYQSGFTTDFDNINLIQIPTTATNKTSTKSAKESSPLITHHRAMQEDDNELACCVIL